MKMFALVLVTLFSVNSFAVGLSPLAENSEIISVVLESPAYKNLVEFEKTKEDVGDAGVGSMRAILVSSYCGEHCFNRYLVLREFWQGHGGANYFMAAIAEIEDGKILNIKSVELMP